MPARRSVEARQRVNVSAFIWRKITGTATHRKIYSAQNAKVFLGIAGLLLRFRNPTLLVLLEHLAVGREIARKRTERRQQRDGSQLFFRFQDLQCASSVAEASATKMLHERSRKPITPSSALSKRDARLQRLPARLSQAKTRHGRVNYLRKRYKQHNVALLARFRKSLTPYCVFGRNRASQNPQQGRGNLLRKRYNSDSRPLSRWRISSTPR